MRSVAMFFRTVVVLSLVVQPLLAIDLLYDFEGDAGATVRDKLTDDGSQDGRLLGNVSLDTIDVPFGSQSVFFDVPEEATVPPFSTIELPETVMGPGFAMTIAGFLDNREEELDFTRIFSSFGGTGPVGNRVILDYDPTGSAIPGLRAIVGGTIIQTESPPIGITDPGYHHYALVVEDDGAVTIYFDGQDVADGFTNDLTYSNEMNIHLGEDPHDIGGSANEQFVGAYDEVLFIDRALSSAQIGDLSAGNTVSSVVTPAAGETAIYYDFENGAIDRFGSDGSQNGNLIAVVSLDSDPANARLGDGSALFEDPLANFSPFSQIEIGPVGDLGGQFTLSAVVNPAEPFSGNALSRLFSSFRGSGGVGTEELVFDINPDADVADIAIRLIVNGVSIVSSEPFSFGQQHTITAVYDFGDVTLYRNGQVVGGGVDTANIAVDLGDTQLFVGEDTAGAVNENFQGTMDDVLILSRALSDAEVADLHALGAGAFLGVALGTGSDLNGDGSVDAADAGIMFGNWGNSGDGDINGDGIVDAADAGIMFADWTGDTPQNVPEPSSAGLLAMGVLLLWWRR